MMRRMTLLAPGTGSRAVILVRLLVGAVFLTEGIQKFLFPAALGVGRFTRIGLPSPEILAPFVGSVEIVCGTLVLIGLAARLAALLLFITIAVAIVTTKVPMLQLQGFWAMAHEARTDWSMFLSSLFLMIVGPGPWSVDGRFRQPRSPRLRGRAVIRSGWSVQNTKVDDLPTAPSSRAPRESCR